MANIAKPSIPWKAYRHFAIITLVATTLLAGFTSDDGRDALAEEIAQREREAELQRISAERTSPKTLTRRRDVSNGNFGGGDLSGFGQPMVSVGATQTNANSIHHSPGAARRGENQMIPGYTKAYLDSLSDEEYRRLVENLRQAGRLSQDQHEQNFENISRDSLQRSGVATNSDELVQ